MSLGPRRDIIALRAPARDMPPAGERPTGPAEKTERPTQPAKKEAEPGQESEAQEKKPTDKPRKGLLRRHPVLLPVGLVAVPLAAVAGYLYWDRTSHFESTDDAFIAARQFAIAPHVAGYVTAVPVTDNEHVNKGGVIAQIDQRDYLAALAQADAQVAGAQAGIHNIDAQIDTQGAQIAAAQAQVNQAQANLDLTKVTWGRDKPLVSQGWATAQQGTVDVQNLKAQQASVDSAQATLKVAQRQIDTLRAQRASAEASLEQAEAQRDQAKLNLGYTTVTADSRAPSST
jgi:membrane fusion protein (multidrug efflux system)